MNTTVSLRCLNLSNLGYITLWLSGRLRTNPLNHLLPSVEHIQQSLTAIN